MIVVRTLYINIFESNFPHAYERATFHGTMYSAINVTFVGRRKKILQIEALIINEKGYCLITGNTV